MKFNDGIPDLTPAAWWALETARTMRISAMFQPARTAPHSVKVGKPIIDLETGERFAHYHAAAAVLGCTSASVSSAIQRKLHARGRWLEFEHRAPRSARARLAEARKRKAAWWNGMKRKPSVAEVAA